MSKGGRYAKKKEKKSLGGKKIALIVIAIVLVLIIAVAIAGVVYYNSMINLINRPERVENSLSQEEIDEIMNYNPDAETIAVTETTVPETTAETIPEYTESGRTITNILVVGQSSRGGGEEYRLADTTILATINSETKTLSLTSFLRDMYIQLPNYKGHTCGMQRFNVCYHLGWKWGDTLGAMEMTNLCLKNNFGIEVDYNVEIDFESFQKVIDLIGGVEVELDADEAAYMNLDERITTQEGKNTLDGYSALVYARMRHSNAGDSDIKRTGRQRELIATIINKVRDLSLTELNEMVKTILPTVTTNMTNEEITTCIWEFLPLLKDLKIETGTCPAEGTFWGEYVDIGGSSASVLKFDAYNNKKILQALCEEPVVETTE